MVSSEGWCRTIKARVGSLAALPPKAACVRGRANAVYRDLIQALVMVQVDHLVLAVPNTYKYRSGGRTVASSDYGNTVAVANALYEHSRMRLPYALAVLGY
jgi:hypothetical protein